MSSSAVTLGRYSGAAVIGRPLDIQVQVLLAPGEDIATQCLAADVYYGDFQIAPGLVSATPRLTGSGQEGTVRIVSQQAINEPIVTLYVRAGCGLPFTRRFVLLADLINEPATAQASPPVALEAGPAAQPGTAASAPVVQQAPAAPAAAPPSPTAAPIPRPAAPVAQTRPAARPAAPARPSKVAPASRAAATVPAPPAAAPRAAAVPLADAPGGSRLQLDPPELPRGTSPNALNPDGSSVAAAPAPTALEMALAAATEEARRNTERLLAIEREMASLREAQANDQARIADLTARLAAAQEQRYTNWVVLLLAGLLLAALGAIVLLVRRQRAEAVLAKSDAARAWWSGPQDAEEEESPRTSMRARLAPSAPVPLSQPEVDFDLDVDSSPAPLTTGAKGRASAFSPTVPPPDRREFAASALGVSRSVATEELFDIQQQADFFVSLGEDDQAIAVLRNHLAESHEPSPLAYLDLFKLYHRLGRKDDYEALRDEFNRVFNAGAPPFDRYTDKGRGLEAYETAFGRIQALWPQPRVLDLIERSLFRDMEEGDTEVFDLEAYRELLMLHSIAKDLIDREGHPTQPPPDFQNTSMQPLKAAQKAVLKEMPAFEGVADDSQRRTVAMDLHVIPSASPRLSLDVNLDDLVAESQFEASLPEVDVDIEPTAGRVPASADDASLIDFELGELDPSGDKPWSEQLRKSGPTKDK